MANIKKTEAVVDKTAEKVEDKVNNTNDLLKTVDKQNKMIEDMKKQMQEMQQAFVSLQSTNTQNATSNEQTSVYVGCRFINGITIYSPKRDVEIFIPYGDDNKVEISSNEMKMLLKTNFVKEFLRKDVLYFENDEDYETFKIYNRFRLDDEELIELVSSKNTNHVVSKLNEYTRDKKDDPVFHCIFYRIVKLSMDGKLSKMGYETRKAIEEYFQFTIDNAQMLIANIEKIK